jgi:4-phytase / acid phosphatase
MVTRLLGVLLLATATVAAAQPKPDEHLELVVALFRHGIRPPLKDPNIPTKYSKEDWPKPAAWSAGDWGFLTSHGVAVAGALGFDYGKYYGKLLRANAKAFLWADASDERTVSTAGALVQGMNEAKLPATTGNRGTGVDPLFHPFKAHCGSIDATKLDRIAKDITDNAQRYIEVTYSVQFGQLYSTLACTDPQAQKCEMLSKVSQNGANRCIGTNCTKPIEWKGQFAYANTATETFLLEYENNMPVGWGRSKSLLSDMMALHDFYFDKTQREPYLAAIDGSNLIREISWTLNRATGTCGRIGPGYAFSGFVGHDTNIASVASLLGLTWSFRTYCDTPVETRNLPDSDPLPAGALVFERWSRGDDDIIRIFYVAQGLAMARDCRFPETGVECPAFRIPIREMSLEAFTALAAGVADKNFLYGCKDGKPKCPR